MAKVGGKIKKLKESLLKIYENQEIELAEIIKRNERVLVALNTGQLMAGIDSTGEKLTEYRSESYANFKRTLNPRGVTDLRLTGEFHDNFFVAVEIPLTIWSYDSKTNSLVSKYGKDIFGLTEENKTVFVAGYVKKEMGEFYKRMLRLR